MLIMFVTSTRAKVCLFFVFPNVFLKIVGKRPFVMECELCVYGQENGESERITRICFAHN